MKLTRPNKSRSDRRGRRGGLRGAGAFLPGSGSVHCVGTSGTSPPDQGPLITLATIRPRTASFH
jgi:hypothetical protein